MISIIGDIDMNNPGRNCELIAQSSLMLVESFRFSTNLILTIRGHTTVIFLVESACKLDKFEQLNDYLNLSPDEASTFICH